MVQLSMRVRFVFGFCDDRRGGWRIGVDISYDERHDFSSSFKLSLYLGVLFHPVSFYGGANGKIAWQNSGQLWGSGKLKIDLFPCLQI